MFENLLFNKKKEKKLLFKKKKNRNKKFNIFVFKRNFFNLA